MSAIGIMQGRLSPPVNGRIQAFPVDTWQQEFARAQHAQLECIEWIYDVESESLNPLRSEAGVAEVRRLAKESGVAVNSVCADYYINERLIGLDGGPRATSIQHLQWLIGQVGMVGARYIVLPFVDQSSLSSHAEKVELSRVLRRVLPAAEQAGVELHLETDWRPHLLCALLESLAHPLLRVNYDTGNSASLGYEPQEELDALGPWLGSVHIKDRLKGGGTVPLGTGDTDFATCFKMFAKASFDRPFILQAARQEGIDEVELAKRNRVYVESQLAAAADRQSQSFGGLHSSNSV